MPYADTDMKLAADFKSIYDRPRKTYKDLALASDSEA
jgi:hypothetical protein